MNKKQIKIISIEILAIIILYIFIKSKYVKIIPKCWVYTTTGMLCPACGGTRCILNIFNGNFLEAFYMHPVFFMSILYVVVINIVYIINLARGDKVLTWLYPKYWYVIIFAIVLMLYTILRNWL